MTFPMTQDKRKRQHSKSLSFRMQWGRPAPGKNTAFSLPTAKFDSVKM
jgi:hypothetical protein